MKRLVRWDTGALAGIGLGLLVVWQTVGHGRFMNVWFVCAVAVFALLALLCGLQLRAGEHDRPAVFDVQDSPGWELDGNEFNTGGGPLVRGQRNKGWTWRRNKVDGR